MKKEVQFHETRFPVSRRIALIVFILFLAVLVLIPPAAAANWYNPSWPDRQNITINKAYVTGTGVTLTNFPVLISISDTYLTSSQVQSNGNDILFTASDGTTKLSHEIENFTQSTGTLVAWVNVPSLPNSTNTTIYMYYGNPAASNQQNAAGVWDSNYNAVWHLSQNPAGSAPQILDSTSNANSATSGGGMTAAQQVPAKINGGLSFNGVNNYLTTNYVQTAVVNYTIETWVKTSTTNLQQVIVQDRGTDAATNGTGQSLTLSIGGTYPSAAGTAGDVAYGLDSNGIYVGDYSTKVVNDNNWHMVAGAWSGPSGTAVSASQFTIYIDGVPVTETALTTGAATSPLTGLFGTQIAQHQPWTTFFNGTLDELRISKILRSPNWISTEYNNQNSPGTFLTVYPQEYPPVFSGFTGTPTSGLYPLTVQFNLTSMFNNATWVNWSWGDGAVTNTSTLLTFNASHTYSSGGTYTVSESAANPSYTNITTLSNYITVYNQTVSGFTGTPTSGLSPLTVQFNLTNMNLVANNATYVNWTFGDGSIANLTSPAAFNASHTYSSGGTYTVIESAANPSYTSITTLSNYITVSSWTNANGCWTATVGNQNIVMWNATGISTWTAPTAIMPNTWYLVVAGGGGGGRYGGGGGAGGFLNGTLTVSSGSTYTVTVGTSGTGATTAAVGGSGRNSSFANTTPTNGIQAMGGGGGGSSSGTLAIRSGAAGGSGGGGVRGGVTPGTGGNGVAPQGNTGGAGSTSGGNYYGGGGGGGTGTGVTAAGTACGNGGNGNVSFITGTSGTYAGGGGGGGFTGGTFGLGGTGGGGAGGVGATAGTNGTPNLGGGGGGGGSTGNGGYGGTGIVIISYSLWNQTVSGFTGLPTSGLAPLAVQFNRTIPNDNATMWNWSFGDGSAWFNTTTVTAANASHTYSGGTYTVTFIAQNPGRQNTTVQSNYIAVYNTTVSGFTANVTSGLFPLAVQFNLTTMANNATYVNWSFGDGSVANLTSPATFNATHTYSSGGTYTVIESAANPYNTSITTQPNYITVNNKTVSGFTANVTSGIFPLAVQFNRTVPNDNATMWNWSYGDGSAWFNTTTVTAANASHIYSSSGTYTVTFVAQNPYYLNTTVMSNYITVGNPTVSGFTGTPTSGLFPLAVQFNRTNPTNDNATMWNWSFGDGSAWFNTTTLSLANASHTYSSGGTYTVTFVAQNPYYLNTTVMSNYITVNNKTVSGFTANVTSGIFPLAVQFNLTTMANNATYVNWTWGDGTYSNTSTLQTFNASHTYSSGGTFTVSESASNPYYTNTTTQLNYISSLSFVDITLNEGSIILGLAAGSSATDPSLIITTTANVPFAITVADSTGRSTYQGYMGSYTGSGYDSGGPDLASPLGLAGTTTGTTTAQTITPPILSAPQTLYSGSAAVTNQNLPTLFTQPAVFSDPRLTGGSSYRIALSFIIQTV